MRQVQWSIGCRAGRHGRRCCDLGAGQCSVCGMEGPARDDVRIAACVYRSTGRRQSGPVLTTPRRGRRQRTRRLRPARSTSTRSGLRKRSSMGPSVNEATKIHEGRSGQSHKRRTTTRAPAKSDEGTSEEQRQEPSRAGARHTGRHKVRRPAAQPHHRGIRREVPAWQCHAGQHTTPQALELTSRALLWMALLVSEGSGCLVLAFPAFSAFRRFSVQRKQTSDKESQQGEAGTGRSTDGTKQTGSKHTIRKKKQTNKQTNKEKAERRRIKKDERPGKRKDQTSVGKGIAR